LSGPSAHRLRSGQKSILRQRAESAADVGNLQLCVQTTPIGPDGLAARPMNTLVLRRGIGMKNLF